MNDVPMPDDVVADQEISALEQLSREAGDDRLFPQRVRDLWQQGKARKARKELLRAAKEEPDRQRKQRQLQHAGDFRLWLEPLRKAPTMTTLNGVGTTLYGSHQKEDDGTYIGTLWFVLVFLPIWPLSSYLVAKAEGGGWHFLARAPRPPAAQMMQRLVVAVVVALAGLGAMAIYRSSTHTDVLAYNGFDRPVTVRVGDLTQVVPPLGDWRFVDVEAQPTSIGGGFVDEDEFESFDVDLKPHADDLVVYNVGGRALLSVGEIVYGRGEPKDGWWLEGGPLIFVEDDIDYAFRKPPETKQVSEGGSIRNLVLEAVDAGVDPSQAFMALLGDGRAEQASQLAMAELRVHPENAALALLVAQTTLEDPEEQRALLRDCIARAPDAVDLHRYYQELWPEEEKEPVLAEYRRMAEEAPESAMHQYLLGRLLDDGGPYFRRALELDPEFDKAYLALGYRASLRGDYRDAQSHYDRYAAFGSGQAQEVLDARLRLRRALGVPHSEQVKLLLATAEASEQDFHVTTLERHVQLENGGDLARLLSEIDSLAEQWWQLEPGSDDLAAARADLAITAGDLDRARSELFAFARTEDRAVFVEWRLALSEGAADSDRSRLVDASDEWWTGLTQSQTLVALELVDAADRDSVLAGITDETLLQAAGFLDDVSALADTARIDTTVSALQLPDRCMVYLAAARRLAGRSDSASTRARAHYQRRAAEISLPGELPYGFAGA